MKSKKIAVATLTVGLSVLTSMSAFAGEWKTDEVGRWYQNDDGSYITNNWLKIKDDDGVERWYLFDENGYSRTWFWDVNGYTYLLSTENMTTTADLYEYLGEKFDGASYTSETFLTNKYPGSMVTGWYRGYTAAGDYKWSFFNDGTKEGVPEGAMLKDTTITEDGITYVIDADGFCVIE